MATINRVIEYIDRAKPSLERAKTRGITDGSRPQSFATRQEVAAMVDAATR